MCGQHCGHGHGRRTFLHIGDGCFTVGCGLCGGSRIGGSDGSLNSFRLHRGIISLGSRGIDAADGLVEGDGRLFRFNGRPLTVRIQWTTQQNPGLRGDGVQVTKHRGRGLQRISGRGLCHYP